MIVRFIAILGFAFGLSLGTPLTAPPLHAASGPTVADALPPHAQVVAMVSLADRPGIVAVAYTAGSSYIGVVAGAPAHPALIWRQNLPYPAATLRAAGPAGVFAGSSHSPLGHAGEVFAYSEQQGTVRSAVEKHRTGIVVGEDGVALQGTTFVIRRHDTHHQGSLRYALVSHFALAGRMYARQAVTRQPDYPRSQYPVPNGVIHTGSGDTILLRLEVADTDAKRETGLMNVHQLDPDSGMVFVWSQPVLESFWMENTFIPLTVAFLAPNGTIQEMQDMQPLTTDLHTPAAAYQYAIEVNQGFFAAQGIKVGDRVVLNLSASG